MDSSGHCNSCVDVIDGGLFLLWMVGWVPVYLPTAAGVLVLSFNCDVDTFCDSLLLFSASATTSSEPPRINCLNTHKTVLISTEKAALWPGWCRLLAGPSALFEERDNCAPRFLPARGSSALQPARAVQSPRSKQSKVGRSGGKEVNNV